MLEFGALLIVAHAAAPSGFEPVATFGDPRFTHDSQIVAAAPLLDGRLRTVAGASVFTWASSGLRGGEAPLPRCGRALAATFAPNGKTLIVRCEAPSASGLYQVTGVRIAPLSIVGPTTYCGSHAYVVAADGVVLRVDPDTGGTKPVAADSVAVGLVCADDTLFVETADRTTLRDLDTDVVRATLPWSPRLTGPAPDGIAAVVETHGTLELLHIKAPGGGVVSRIPLPAPATAVAFGPSGQSAIVTSGRLVVRDPDGTVRWQTGTPTDFLVPVSDAFLWVVRGTRIDRHHWATGESFSAHLTNRSAPFDVPPRRAAFFAGEGDLYSWVDDEVVILDPEQETAWRVARFPAPAVAPSVLAGGRIAAALPSGMHIVSPTTTEVLRPELAVPPAWVLASPEVDRVAAGVGDEVWLWSRLRADARPERARLGAAATAARWESAGQALWAASAAGLHRITPSGSARSYEFDVGRAFDVGFDNRGRVRALLGPNPDRPTQRAAMSVVTPRGKVLHSRPAPAGARTMGFVPGTLEVWVVDPMGVLTVWSADLGEQTGRLSLPAGVDGVPHFSWSLDGKKLANEATDGLVHVWARTQVSATTSAAAHTPQR